MKIHISIGVAILAMLTVAFTLNQTTLNASSSQGKAFPELIQLPTGFAPEGIATGKETSFFVGSLSGGAIYKGDLRTGAGEVLVEDMEGDMAVGLDVDVRANHLFVCGGRNGDARVYNSETGEPLASYTLSTAENKFINDVIVTRDAAYFTNSMESVIYKLPLGPGGELPSQSEVQTLELSDNYNTVQGFNTNGIEATPNGKQLIIVNSSTGELYTVNPMNGMAEQIDLGGENVQTGDGILLDGKTLYVVQNRRNQIAVVDLNDDYTSGEITKTITSSDFAVPTTVAQHGNSLYAVNAKFGTDSEGTPYEVVKVSK